MAKPRARIMLALGSSARILLHLLDDVRHDVGGRGLVVRRAVGRQRRHAGVLRIGVADVVVQVVAAKHQHGAVLGLGLEEHLHARRGP